jgi:hypothetical protein
MKMSKEEELIKVLQSKQEQLNAVNEQLSTLKEKTEDAQRIIEEQRERELPEEIEDTEALEHFLQSQYPYAYGEYKKYGKVVCSICKEEFKDFQEFVNHWETKHLDEYGAYKPQEQPQYAEKPQEESKIESKKELTPQEATRLWLESKKTKRRKP